MSGTHNHTLTVDIIHFADGSVSVVLPTGIEIPLDTEASAHVVAGLHPVEPATQLDKLIILCSCQNGAHANESGGICHNHSSTTIKSLNGCFDRCEPCEASHPVITKETRPILWPKGSRVAGWDKV